MKTKRINLRWIQGPALLAIVAGLGFITSCTEPPTETITITIPGASDLVGNYSGFFKHSDPATPASPSTLEISSPNNHLFTATLTIALGTDAPIAYVGGGTVSARGDVSITAQNGEDTVELEVEAFTFDGGGATLDGTGHLHQADVADIEGTFILLRSFDFDPQNPPPSLDGLEFRGIRNGDDGSSGPITVVLNQSPQSNSLTGQAAFGLSSPPDATTAQVVDDPPLTWSVLGTVNNAGDVVWIAQTGEHRLQTILKLPDVTDPFQLAGTYTLHSFTKRTGILNGCACPYGYACVETGLTAPICKCWDVGCQP